MSSVIHLQEKCDAASGRVKAQMVLKQANIINVFTEEIIQADLAICGDTIVGIGSYQGEVEIDCRDKFICPGFIDAHVHVESTMVMPSDLAKEVLKSGTTTMIADPHELVNVTGIKALEFLIEATEDIPTNLYIMLPSCVPSTKFETNGKSFTAEDMVPFLNHPRVLGLGEVMSYNDVINGQEEMLKKLIVNEGKVLDGHAPDLIGKELQAYACAGIETDHECVNFQEAYEKVKAGLKILIREGSAAKNLEAIVKGLIESKIPTDNFMFCTDDKHLEDIQREGHISWNIKQAIGLGMSPITAIKMASYNTARAYGLKKLGAVAAGYRADLVILEDLENMKVSQVIKDGIIITDESFANNKDKYIDKAMLNTVKFDNLTAEKIKVKAFEKNYVIEMMPHQIITKKVYEEIPSQYGYFTANEIYSKLCVIERHRGSGNVAAAPLKGFGIKGGAIATSVAHDSHNIIAAGDKDEDIILAVNRLKEIQGGYVIASKGKIIGELPLQVAGLISTLPSEKVQSITKEMLALARAMGVPAYLDPFITLSFMALPVIPEIRLTDLGLFDVEKFDLI
jgi:adenine deaminase